MTQDPAIQWNALEPYQLEPRLFLSSKEVISAIAADFDQYGPQPSVFKAVIPLLAAPGIFWRQLPRPGLWTKDDSGLPVLHTPLSDTGTYFISRLGEQPWPLDTLSLVCRMVFQVRSWPGKDADGTSGVWIENDMAQFTCLQCGQCCRDMEYENDVTQADFDLWQALGRQDILDHVMVIPLMDGTAQYRIWVEPGTDRLLPSCPWLEKNRSSNRYDCLIQDIKPAICREYPYTRKHARKTGCPGHFKKIEPDIYTGR